MNSLGLAPNFLLLCHSGGHSTYVCQFPPPLVVVVVEWSQELIYISLSFSSVPLVCVDMCVMKLWVDRYPCPSISSWEVTAVLLLVTFTETVGEWVQELLLQLQRESGTCVCVDG